MEIKIIELRELKPSKEMCLTNGEIVKPPNESIYLGCNDNPDNWHEITAEEYNEIQTAIEEQHDFDTMKEGEV